MKDNVIHFIFCEKKIDKEDPLEPFVYEVLNMNFPCVFIIDVLAFSYYLDMFNSNQLVTVWVHLQSDTRDTTGRGQFLGVRTGNQLISNYPELKFKYVTRQHEHPDFSSDNRKTPIISLNDIHGMLSDISNHQTISEFYVKNNIMKKKKTISEKPTAPVTIGDNFSGVFIQGSDNKTDNKVIIKQKINDLKTQLENEHVDKEDINELLSFIESDVPDYENKRFGDKTNNWIQKMVGKALNGTWQVGVGSAAGLLTEMLKGFFGM